jgi:hypothetical protein
LTAFTFSPEVFGLAVQQCSARVLVLLGRSLVCLCLNVNVIFIFVMLMFYCIFLQFCIFFSPFVCLIFMVECCNIFAEYTVTTSVQSTSLVIRFSINELNTLRWTFISFVKKLFGVKSEFSIYPPNIKLRIFLRKNFPLYFFKTSETVSDSQRPTTYRFDCGGVIEYLYN